MRAWPLGLHIKKKTDRFHVAVLLWHAPKQSNFTKGRQNKGRDDNLHNVVGTRPAEWKFEEDCLIAVVARGPQVHFNGDILVDPFSVSLKKVVSLFILWIKHTAVYIICGFMVPMTRSSSTGAKFEFKLRLQCWLSKGKLISWNIQSTWLHNRSDSY